MSETPRNRPFEELVETSDLDADERRRLERVHELLLAAGPPAELPAELARPPAPPGRVVPLPERRRLPLRRTAIAAPAAIPAAFALGYVTGNRGDGEAFEAERVVALAGGGATGTLSVGPPDGAGNRPIEVTVEGLPAHTSERGYYELFLERDGEPTIPCGGFRLSGDGASETFRFVVPYSLDEDETWVLTTIEPGEVRWPGDVVMRTVA